MFGFRVFTKAGTRRYWSKTLAKLKFDMCRSATLNNQIYDTYDSHMS